MEDHYCRNIWFKFQNIETEIRKYFLRIVHQYLHKINTPTLAEYFMPIFTKKTNANNAGSILFHY